MGPGPGDAANVAETREVDPERPPYRSVSGRPELISSHPRVGCRDSAGLDLASRPAMHGAGSPNQTRLGLTRWFAVPAVIDLMAGGSPSSPEPCGAARRSGAG